MKLSHDRSGVASSDGELTKSITPNKCGFAQENGKRDLYIDQSNTEQALQGRSVR